MPAIALLLILTSSAMHAFWNLLTKKSDDKLVFIWLTMGVILGLYLIPCLLFAQVAHITHRHLVYPAVSGFFQALYCALLAGAYTRGDLSLVYPLTRGTIPVFIAILARILLAERITLSGALGITVIVLGIYILHLPSLTIRYFLQPITALGGMESQLALLTGISSSVYHIVDKVGVQRIHPFVYLYIVQVALFAFLTVFMVFRKRHNHIKAEWVGHKKGVIWVAALCFLSYLLVLFAMRLSRISYIGAVRNFSMVFGVILGGAILREKHISSRLSASVLIVLGTILIAFKG